MHATARLDRNGRRPCAGVLSRVLEQEGTVVKMGQRIAVVAPN